MGFSRQEHCSGLSCLPPGDLPDPGIQPRLPVLPADSLPYESPEKPLMMHYKHKYFKILLYCYFEQILLKQKQSYIYELYVNIHATCVCMCGKSLQLCLTLCDAMDSSSLSGSSVHGTLQARTLERVAMPSSRDSSRPRDWTLIFYTSCIGRRVLYH